MSNTFERVSAVEQQLSDLSEMLQGVIPILFAAAMNQLKLIAYLADRGGLNLADFEAFVYEHPDGCPCSDCQPEPCLCPCPDCAV